MALCLVGLIAAALLGLSAGEGGTPALIGCAFAAGSGVAITIATLYAKRLHDAGASAAAVVSTRFLGVLRAAAVALSFGPEARAPPRSRPRPGSRSRRPPSCSWRCRSISTRSA